MSHRNLQLLFGLVTVGAIASSGCRLDENLGTAGNPEQKAVRQLAVPTNGLIGEWKLDGNVNDTKSGFNATLFGSPPYVNAHIGQGLDLTGNGNGGAGGKFVEMPSNSTLNDLSEGAAYSISAWFNPASAPSGDDPANFWMVVGKTNSQAMGIVYNPAGRFAARHYLNLNGNVLELATASSTSTLNQWHHVVAVVTKGSSTVSGSLKLYVDGQLSQTETWAGGTPAKDFMAAKWRIGKSDDDWSAKGLVDQVRFYNVALSQANVTDLFQETASQPTFRFPVGMSKDQNSDLGTDAFFYNPDGKMSAVASSMLPILQYAKQHGARVVMNVTGPNTNFDTNDDSMFVMSKWTAKFDAAANAISPDSVRAYVRDGTLIGVYVIDEPWTDFKNFTHTTLESLCHHEKDEWPWLPCLARTDNTVIDDNTPAGYHFTYVDAGWAQATAFKTSQATGGTVLGYFQDNLNAGNALGLGLWYGFNMVAYVNVNARPGCQPRPERQTHCAMTPAELRALADAIETLGSGKGCGVSGYRLPEDAQDPEREYFFDANFNSALKYLWNHTAGRSPAIQPGPCNIRGDLPAP